MTGGWIQKEDVRIVNNYTPNKGAPKHIEQILTDIKEEFDTTTKIVEDSNTRLTSMDRSSREKKKNQ